MGPHFFTLGAQTFLIHFDRRRHTIDARTLLPRELVDRFGLFITLDSITLSPRELTLLVHGRKTIIA